MTLGRSRVFGLDAREQAGGSSQQPAEGGERRLARRPVIDRGDQALAEGLEAEDEIFHRDGSGPEHRIAPDALSTAEGSRHGRRRTQARVGETNAAGHLLR